MKNEFVPYEEALALKKLGFEEKCFGFYSLIYDLMICNTSKIYEESAECLAPLYQQAFRWFRENGKKLGLYDFGILSDGKYKYYYFYNDGYTKKSNDSFYGGKNWATYEEAELACLKKLIEILKQNKNE